MEASCRQPDKQLCLQSPRISRAVTVLVLGLAFYSKDLHGVGYAINVFLLLYLSPLVVWESELLARRWYIMLSGGALSSFADTSLLLPRQRVEPVAIWEAAENQVEAWGVFCHSFLGDAAVHPATYEV